MSALRRAAVQMVDVLEGRTEVGIVSALMELKQAVRQDRQQSRERTAVWRRAHKEESK